MDPVSFYSPLFCGLTIQATLHNLPRQLVFCFSVNANDMPKLLPSSKKIFWMGQSACKTRIFNLELINYSSRSRTLVIGKDVQTLHKLMRFLHKLHKTSAQKATGSWKQEPVAFCAANEALSLPVYSSGGFVECSGWSRPYFFSLY